MTALREKRWLWWGQTRDALTFFLGMGLLMWEAYQPGSDAATLAAGLACLSSTGTGILSRWLRSHAEDKGDSESERWSHLP